MTKSAAGPYCESISNSNTSVSFVNLLDSRFVSSCEYALIFWPFLFAFVVGSSLKTVKSTASSE